MIFIDRVMNYRLGVDWSIGFIERSTNYRLGVNYLSTGVLVLLKGVSTTEQEYDFY